MGRSRARTIYLAGEEVYRKSKTTGDLRLLQAMAAMVAEATKKGKAKPKDAPKTPFAPQELYELMLARVPHIVACEPYNSRWFGALGKKMQATNGLEREDMERLVQWVEGGGLEFGEDWSFSHVIKHFDTWLTKARRTNGSTGVRAGGLERMME